MYLYFIATQYLLNNAFVEYIYTTERDPIS